MAAAAGAKAVGGGRVGGDCRAMRGDANGARAWIAADECGVEERGLGLGSCTTCFSVTRDVVVGCAMQQVLLGGLFGEPLCQDDRE